MAKWRVAFDSEAETQEEIFGEFSSLADATTYLNSLPKEEIVNKYKNWCEEYEIEFEESAIDNLTLEIFEVLPFKPDFDVENLIEKIQEQGYECGGEYADGFLEHVTQPQLVLLQEYLQQAFDNWASVTNTEAKFYQLGRVETYVKT